MTGHGLPDPQESCKHGITPVVIGFVRSPLKNLKDCPKWNTDGPEAVIELNPVCADGLDGMERGQQITLITWLHQANREVLHLKQEHSISKTPRGVFSSRSPARPNPIGLHDVTVLEIIRGESGVSLRVNALEALDGTPVLDIKTERSHYLADPELSSANAAASLIDICAGAHAAGFMSGFSGNASMRLGDFCLITCSGSAKGWLSEKDFVLMGVQDARIYTHGVRPSSESMAHLEIYRHQPLARAVLHTHPPALLALGLKKPESGIRERLNLPLFEAQAVQEQLSATPRFEPGSENLAHAVGQCAVTSRMIWMEGHGLAVWSDNAGQVLPMTEELEHLAKIALNI